MMRQPNRTTTSTRIWWILGSLLLVLIIIPSILSGMITDWMWFDSQRLAEVYTTRLWLAVGVFFGAGILAALFCWANWAVAWRIASPGALYPGQRAPFSHALARGITLAAAIAVGLIMGLV